MPFSKIAKAVKKFWKTRREGAPSPLLRKHLQGDLEPRRPRRAIFSGLRGDSIQADHDPFKSALAHETDRARWPYRATFQTCGRLRPAVPTKNRIFIEVPHDLLRSPPRMKMAWVATIDSFPELIVGFSKGRKTHGYCPKRSNRGYLSSHFHKSLSCP